MSSFLGRDREVCRAALVLGPAEIKDDSCEVKAREFDDEISRVDDFLAGRGAPYKGASFAEVFLYDMIVGWL